MIRFAIAATAALIALAAAMPAQAGGGFIPNGRGLNGLALNGAELNARATQGRATQGINPQGRTTQGIKQNGVDSHEATGGVSLLTIELAR